MCPARCRARRQASRGSACPTLARQTPISSSRSSLQAQLSLRRPDSAASQAADPGEQQQQLLLLLLQQQMAALPQQQQQQAASGTAPQISLPLGFAPGIAPGSEGAISSGPILDHISILSDAVMAAIGND